MENVNAEQLKQLQESGSKILVDFWAPWCGPCKQLIPRLENLEQKYPNIKFVKINVDENTDVALDLNIRTVPTVIIYDGENVVNRSTGANQDVVYTNILNTL
jgi:thioredoxin 1